MKRIVLFALIAGLGACSSRNGADAGSGRQQRMRVAVGEIREVQVPGRQEGPVELIGTSENNEVVEVSRRELAPPVDTLRQKSGPTTFQIKGVTTGTAKVVFSEKRMGETGSGRTLKTYVVQVVTN